MTPQELFDAWMKSSGNEERIEALYFTKGERKIERHFLLLSFLAGYKAMQEAGVERDRLLGRLAEIGDTLFPDPATYERDRSHDHCWNQGGKPACGQPLENHKQCCLCDKKYPRRSNGAGDV